MSVVIFSQTFDSKVRKSEAMARAAWKTGQISVTMPSIFMWLQLLGWTQSVGSGGCREAPVGMELQKQTFPLSIPTCAMWGVWRDEGMTGKMQEEKLFCFVLVSHDLKLFLINIHFMEVVPVMVIGM